MLGCARSHPRRALDQATALISVGIKLGKGGALADQTAKNPVGWKLQINRLTISISIMGNVPVKFI
jgi:hypothetical protein